MMWKADELEKQNEARVKFFAGPLAIEPQNRRRAQG